MCLNMNLLNLEDFVFVSVCLFQNYYYKFVFVEIMPAEVVAVD